MQIYNTYVHIHNMYVYGRSAFLCGIGMHKNIFLGVCACVLLLKISYNTQTQREKTYIAINNNFINIIMSFFQGSTTRTSSSATTHTQISSDYCYEMGITYWLAAGTFYYNKYSIFIYFFISFINTMLHVLHVYIVNFVLYEISYV